jgi:hypothetical protein
MDPDPSIFITDLHDANKKPVLRIRIHRIYMFLGLLDPDPDPSVRGMNPAPDPDLDPSITKQKKKEKS